MKNLIITFVTALLIEPIYAQPTYYPLIETGKTWHVVEGGFGGFSTYTYKVEGDTMISQENFKILYRSYEEFPVSWEKYGYIREDEDKKVYYSPFNFNDTIFNEPSMVYDFGVELNDTLTITSFAYNSPYDLEIVITGIDSVLIGENKRRRVTFACEFFYDNFWIEGIGSNNGLLEPGFYCYIVCPISELICVKEGNNVIYHVGYYDDCYVVDIDETIVKEQQFLVYPNPAKNIMYIIPQTNIGSSLQFELYNLENKAVIRRGIIDFNPLVINITNLKDGLYLYRIIDNQELAQNGKIIVKK